MEETSAELVSSNPEAEIEALLNELYNDSAKRRWSTINTIAGRKINDERITTRLQTLAAQDPMPYVREAATTALKTLGVTATNTPASAGALPSTGPVSSAPSGDKTNTFKFTTVILIILGLITPLWPISLPLFWFLAYRSYKSPS